MFGRLLVKQQGRSTGCICAEAVFLAFCLAIAEVGAAQERPTAEELTVKPVKQRISDQAIEADKNVFKHLRAKLAEAHVRDIPEQTCLLVKAEAWLALAEEEYDENEEGDIVDVTLREAQRLMRSLEDRTKVAQARIPLFQVTEPARPDLWEQLAQLSSRDSSCACGARARLEVQLSWADHERQEGWQHARPYIETAERLAESARREADHVCPLTALVQSTAPAPEPVPTPLPAPEPEPLAESIVITLSTLPWSVHFPTNRASVSPVTAKVLGTVSEVLLKHPKALIRLEGHTDQRGEASYNKILSERRTQAVKDFLAKAGIPAGHIETASFGKSLPLTKGRQNRDLARNRRVVIVVTNIEEIRSEEQESDLQMDQRKRRELSRQIEVNAKQNAKQRQSNEVKTGRSRKTH